MQRTRPRPRVALLSLHTSPLDRPGAGDSGGMNVFVRTAALGLAARGVSVDIFTRCAGRAVPEVEILSEGTRVIQVHAGPCEPIPKQDLPRLVPGFAGELLERVDRERLRYDVVQGHYWLSGLAGLEAAGRWRVPLVALFHTLARVKNLTVADGEAPEPEERAAGEERVIRAASRVVVPTSTEASHVASLYGTPPARLRVVPPGVDTGRFRPRPKDRARSILGLGPEPLVLVAGRLQRLKGGDIAISAFREAVASHPDAALLIVGGTSGAGDDEPARLRRLADASGIGDRVRFLDAVPHERMPWLYAAADVVMMPSRSESFGMVALEAQACGVPVIAGDVGGLRHVVNDGTSGFLVRPGDPAAFAERLMAVLGDRALAARLASGGIRHASRFSWRRTVSRLLDVYRELRPEAFDLVELPPVPASGP